MAVTRTEVTEIYVATFDRAPDAAGLDYWVATGLTIEGIAASFFVQPETQRLYPDTMSDAEFVDAVYNNVYNHSGDLAGEAYWIGELENGTPRDAMIISMVNGAQGADQDTLENKTEVGLYFADNGAELTLGQAYEVMEDVTNDDQTVADAEVEVDVWSDAANALPLTTATDDIVGSDLDDIVTGLLNGDTPTKNTLNAADTIDGGGGDDLLQLSIVGLVPSLAVANMSNMEILAISSELPAAVALDLAGTTGLETIDLSGSVTRATITNVVDIVDLELSTSVRTTTTINYAAATIVDPLNRMDIINDSAASQGVIVNGIENITLHLTGQAGSATRISSSDLHTITVDGITTGTNTLVALLAPGDEAKVIDLSGTTGAGMIVDISISDASGINIISGGGADTINLDVGNDTVTYSRAEQSQGMSSDTINGFATLSDNINLTNAIIYAGGTATGAELAVTAFDGAGIGALAFGDSFNGATVYVDVSAATAIVYVDADGSGDFDATDMTIHVAGTPALVAADFIV